MLNSTGATAVKIFKFSGVAMEKYSLRLQVTKGNLNTTQVTAMVPVKPHLLLVSVHHWGFALNRHFRVTTVCPVVSARLSYSKFSCIFVPKLHANRNLPIRTIIGICRTPR